MGFWICWYFLSLWVPNYTFQYRIHYHDATTSPPNPLTLASLTLETYLGHGRVYDLYRGHLTCPPTVTIPIPCIAKFVDFDTFPPDSESNDHDPWVFESQ